ncbi:alpha-amylase family glycosyl hydrolase [uncultured Treponema sp.]|uniref:alpha-amylase family glycosyl hydrolase n=1 Tax=uncultured Treponema sp. TaxID=162155 RepID=UPI002596004C|nr:alpha-amylase family glycosyl hydrolase [uncultured Treponema sp.]
MKKVKFYLCTVLLSAVLFASCSNGSSSGNDDSSFPEHLLSYVGNESYISPKNVSVKDAENQSTDLKDGWWNDTAFYHIWVKSFCDSNDDGCGDFNGIKSKLDYIKNDLGCDGIWLSPIFECDYKSKSPSVNMHGYDVKDYYAVNNYFGTEDDLLSLIQACHDKNIKIIFDFVPNHTGKGNAWFTDSCEGGEKKDWYVWNNSKLNWNPGMGSSDTWHKNPQGNDYYYAAFWEGQPDLNFRNYEVREEMKNVVRYWLNKGFDGLRIDAVRYLIETEKSLVDTQETHEWFRELRTKVIDSYKETSPKFMVCEAWIENNRPALDAYFGSEQKPEFNMVLDFNQGRGCYNSIYNSDGRILTSTLYKNPSEIKGYGTFIGNHDEYMGRIGTWGYVPSIKLITAMSLLRPTVPFIYYGNEIGMQEGNYNGDLRLRTKLNWEDVEKQRNDNSSILSLNKALLALRKEYPALFRNGTVTELESATIDTETNNSVYTATAYTISDRKDTLLCVYSLANISDNKFWFDRGGLDISSYSVLIGVNNKKNLSLYGSDIEVEYIAPYETRVYYIGDNTKEMLFTDKRLFLRGDMNGWGYDEMLYDSEKRCFDLWYKLDPDSYQFKFDAYCDRTLSYGSGEENIDGKSVSLGETMQTSTEEGKNTNFLFTPSSSASGTYRFTFYEDDNTFVITQE